MSNSFIYPALGTVDYTIQQPPYILNAETDCTQISEKIQTMWLMFSALEKNWGRSRCARMRVAISHRLYEVRGPVPPKGARQQPLQTSEERASQERGQRGHSGSMPGMFRKSQEARVAGFR